MTETIGAGGSGAYPTKEHAMQAAADRIGKKEARAMTDFVTVRRDALRALVEVSVAYHGIPLVAPITEAYTRAVDDRLAAMIVSPWQPIETIPTDADKPWDERRFWLLYAPEREGLPAMQSVCRYHDDAGWCIDELRTATHWQPLPEPPK